MKIGIFGAENSHAMAFSGLFNNDKAFGEGWTVVATGGEDQAAAEAVCDKCGVGTIVQKPEDMLDMVQAGMITSRDGALHLKYARPFLEKGMPVFVDKPFTRDIAQARQLVALARNSGSLVMGGSSVKLVDGVDDMAQTVAAAKEEGKLIGGSVWAPVDMVNDYGNFWFYSAHLVELLMAIFGQDVRKVRANATEKGVTAILQYDDFDVTAHFNQGLYEYGASVFMAGGMVSRNFDISDCYKIECEHFVNMINTKTIPQPVENLVRSVCVLRAIELAFESGEVVAVEEA